MTRPRGFALFPLVSILWFCLFALPLTACSQQPSHESQAVQPQSTTPIVRKLLDAGNKAMDASPPQLEEAEKQYTAALAEARRRADTSGESKALLNLGNVYGTRKKVTEALGYYQQGLAVSQAHNDKLMQARALQNIAILYEPTQPEKSLDYIRQAIVLFPEAGKTRVEVHILTMLGNRLEGQNQIAQAIDAYNQAVPLARSIGDQRAEADVMWYLGRAYVRAGDSDPQFRTKARDSYQQAAGLYDKVHDLYDEAWTYRNMGDINSSEWHYEEARPYLLKALSLYRRLPNQKDIVIELQQLANINKLSGRYLEALNNDQEALAISKKISDKHAQAVEMIAIASLYHFMGQRAIAHNFFLKALPLLEKSGDLQNSIIALDNIQYYYWRLDDRARAQVYLNKLIPLLQRPATGNERLWHLSGLAGIYYQIEEYDKAKITWEQLLAEEQKNGTVSIAETLGSLGLVEESLGHFDKSLDYYNQELGLLNEPGSELAKSSVLSGIAGVEQKRGNKVAAASHFSEAITLLERVRASFSGLSEAKSTFLNSPVLFRTYQDYLGLLLDLNRSNDAFALAQKMKARSLLDILYDGKVQLAGSLSPEEREQEKQLRQKSDGLNFRLVREGVQNEIGSRRRAENIKLQLADAERDLQVFEDRLYAAHPTLAEKRAATTITLEDVSKFLPDDTALLEYVTLKTGKADETVLFVVTQQAGNPVLSTHILPIPQKILTQQVDALRDACADPRKPYRTLAQTLYRTLIAPAEGRIAGKKRLLICPDGPLWDTPFAALIADGNSTVNGASGSNEEGQTGSFLIQRFEIAYAYSATGARAELTVQAEGNRRRPTKTMLVFANPDFGDEQRFGDTPNLPGQRPIGAPSRPIGAPSRRIHAASRPIGAPSRPIGAPSRPIGAPSRPIGSPSRPIGAPSRPIGAPSRDLFLPRGGSLVQLPGTQQEAEAIRVDFKDADIYTRGNAQEGVAKKEAGNYRYLHFATHGFFNDAAPLLSSIVLAIPNKASGEDGFLTAREIFDLDLHADLVVLSACNTARGEKRSGEGIIGLTWALFAAGAPTQVVSQWSVNDLSTALLMQRFYANLTHGYMQKGAALRAAALSLLNPNPKSRSQNRKYTHPYYWAPFILLGNWG